MRGTSRLDTPCIHVVQECILIRLYIQTHRHPLRLRTLPVPSKPEFQGEVRYSQKHARNDGLNYRQAQEAQFSSHRSR
jgi:hypothetical protein